ncbi:hypothetical protein [Oerskovia enterophila]|uniref:DUF222 domain-containing protein n=1 Tax=Oerskovia enterophila TaxID=43678 RepID=A0ABX2Y9T5_9CELL|nr:hypothetical protein [Oerskovia enterophila]OCI32781.1 hypothetical protein OERS_03730 [Oerskovia enterophila]
MSTHDFDTDAHPRQSDGKFATKAVSEAPGGLSSLGSPTQGEQAPDLSQMIDYSTEVEHDAHAELMSQVPDHPRVRRAKARSAIAAADRSELVLNEGQEAFVDDLVSGRAPGADSILDEAIHREVELRRVDPELDTSAIGAHLIENALAVEQELTVREQARTYVPTGLPQDPQERAAYLRDAYEPDDPKAHSLR